MSNEIQFLLYSLPDDEGKVQVVIKDETIWCTQKAMAQLFGVGVPAVSKHLGHIFEEGELDRNTTVSKMEIVVNRGFRGSVNEEVEFYSLDAIIAVGYRVSSLKATRFRQWATKILNEYIKKGFVMDDERLKQGKAVFGKDYFRELLERVRSIRASERRIWQQITDIYAECSIDYDKNAPTTRDFYAMIQNRFHYAITGHTAAKIIYTKADHTKDHMGMTTWKNAPDGRVLKSDSPPPRTLTITSNVSTFCVSSNGCITTIRPVSRWKYSFKGRPLITILPEPRLIKTRATELLRRPVP